MKDLPCPPGHAPDRFPVVVGFEARKCCLLLRGADGRPRYCGEAATGSRPMGGLRTHDGSTCYRCGPHRAEEEARGLKFEDVTP